MTVGTPTRTKTAVAPSLGELAATGEGEEEFTAGKMRTTKATVAAEVERERCCGGYGTGGGVRG